MNTVTLYEEIIIELTFAPTRRFAVVPAHTWTQRLKKGSAHDKL